MKVFHKFTLIFLLLAGTLSAQNPDVSIFRFINNRHSPATDPLFKFQSNTVKPVSIGLPLGMIVTGIASKDRRAEDYGVLMFLAHLMNYGITHGTKKIVNRRRPYEVLPDVHLPAGPEGTRSFPSGHTSAAFTSAAMMKAF